MQQQRGFTLIELIIVIVILGILAVTAAPKFIDIQGDATSSTLKGVKAALLGGAQLVYAKSAVAGKQKNVQGISGVAGDTQVTIANQQVEIDLGYPDADKTTSLTELAKWVDLSASDFTLTAGTGTTAVKASPAANFFGIAPANNANVDYSIATETGDSCHVVYKEATSTSPPVVTVVTGKC